MRLAQRNPPLLETAVFIVQHRQQQIVRERGGRVVKGHAVLPDVACRLRRVPLELEHTVPCLPLPARRLQPAMGTARIAASSRGLTHCAHERSDCQDDGFSGGALDALQAEWTRLAARGVFGGSAALDAEPRARQAKHHEAQLPLYDLGRRAVLADHVAFLRVDLAGEPVVTDLVGSPWADYVTDYPPWRFGILLP